MTNCLLRVTGVATMRKLYAALSDKYATLGVTLKSVHLNFSHFISIIIYPIDNTADEWPTNFYRCLGGLNLNQGRLEQDPGLGCPVGGVRMVFINLEIIIFYSPNECTNIQEWYQATFLRITWRPGNKFKKVLNHGSIHACPGRKGSLSQNEG